MSFESWVFHALIYCEDDHLRGSVSLLLLGGPSRNFIKQQCLTAEMKNFYKRKKRQNTTTVAKTSYEHHPEYEGQVGIYLLTGAKRGAAKKFPKSGSHCPGRLSVDAGHSQEL